MWWTNLHTYITQLYVQYMQYMYNVKLQEYENRGIKEDTIDTN